MVSIKTILAVCVSTIIAAGLAVSAQPDIKATITETGEKTMVVVENVGYRLLGKGEAAAESGECDYSFEEASGQIRAGSDVKIRMEHGADAAVETDAAVGVDADVSVGADVDVGVGADVDVGVGVDAAGSVDANTNVSVNADLESALDLSSKVQEATICICGALGNK